MFAGVAIVSLVIGVGVATYSSTPQASGRGETLPIGGVAHFTLFDAKGNVVGTWSVHNSLTSQAIGQIALCLSGVANPFPPGDPSYISSCGGAFNQGLTQAIVLGWAPTGTASGCPYTQMYAPYSNQPIGTQAGISCATEPTTIGFYPAACEYPAYQGATIPDCTGWTATATFSSSDFSSNGCGSSCTVAFALALTGTTWGGGGFTYTTQTVNGRTLPVILVNDGNAFDLIQPSIAIAQGDSLQVTIQFTVS